MAKSSVIVKYGANCVLKAFFDDLKIIEEVSHICGSCCNNINRKES